MGLNVLVYIRIRELLYCVLMTEMLRSIIIIIIIIYYYLIVIISFILKLFWGDTLDHIHNKIQIKQNHTKFNITNNKKCIKEGRSYMIINMGLLFAIVLIQLQVVAV